MTGVRCTAVFAGAVLVLAAKASAQAPPQQVVLPGPVPYPTVSPPLTAYSPTPPGVTRYVFHIESTQWVRVGVDQESRPISVRVRERLAVSGRGDYQFGITGPIADVQPAPSTDSQPGLRVNQVLWAGFSPGRKVLAADVTLRPRHSAPFLPVRLRLQRHGGGVSLSVVNATRTPVLEYAGVVRPREIAAIEAPIHVEGELRVPGARPVRFAQTLGDGEPLAMHIHAEGTGALGCGCARAPFRSRACCARPAVRAGWRRSSGGRSEGRFCCTGCCRRGCSWCVLTSTRPFSRTPTPTAATGSSTTTRPRPLHRRAPRPSRSRLRRWRKRCARRPARGRRVLVGAAAGLALWAHS
jgi:hypothetical protein